MVQHFIADAENPWRIVAALRDALAPGSHLVLAHGSGPWSAWQGRHNAPPGSSQFHGVTAAVAGQAAVAGRGSWQGRPCAPASAPCHASAQLVRQPGAMSHRNQR
ncbi:MAG TPA: SAM-dependent methyltransferase [Streptosporangiaceae bacterium]|nr:SAM-dependent methyltransferase [Streptosporangiaceae bacterium]